MVKSSDELARRVSNVLQRLSQKNVTVNQEKCVFNASTVKFLGHLLTEEGIMPDPDLSRKITSCKPPQDRSELECFLGLINFYGRMIEGFAKLTQPLHKLRKKDVEFHWTAVHQDSFEKLIKKVAEKPVLQPYSLSAPVTVTTDASQKAIGGVLSQSGKPVMFVSRSLSETEQRYSNVEREALSIVWCCLRLRQLLVGRHFTLISDHKPLLKIYGGQCLPKVASSRLMRWAILLQQFDFSIEYKPGSEIPHADSLSRLRFKSDKSHGEDIVINDVEDHSISDEFLQTLKSVISGDRLSMAVMERCKCNNWAPPTVR